MTRTRLPGLLCCSSHACSCAHAFANPFACASPPVVLTRMVQMVACCPIAVLAVDALGALVAHWVCVRERHCNACASLGVCERICTCTCMRTHIRNARDGPASPPVVLTRMVACCPIAVLAVDALVAPKDKKRRVADSALGEGWQRRAHPRSSTFRLPIRSSCFPLPPTEEGKHKTRWAHKTDAHTRAGPPWSHRGSKPRN